MLLRGNIDCNETNLNPVEIFSITELLPNEQAREKPLIGKTKTPRFSFVFSYVWKNNYASKKQMLNVCQHNCAYFVVECILDKRKPLLHAQLNMQHKRVPHDNEQQ